MQLHHLLPVVGLGLVAPATAALAQQPASATDLDNVLVTATRTEIALADSLAPAQVIDRADIERSQARSVPDLLRGRAGIDVGNQGGLGKLSNLSIRGSEADHVLVLIDGIRVGSVSAGLTAFQDIPVDQIDRIEIVRGPRSSLYGSEAVGGVIQILTRRDKGVIAPRFRVSAGTHSLREASAGIGGGIGHGWFGADVAYQRTDGINACRGTSGDPNNPFDGAGCFVDEPDYDGYRNRSLNLRGGLSASDALSIEGTALRAESRNEFDGDFGGNEAHNVQQVVGGKLTYTPKTEFRLTLQAGRSYDKSKNFYASPNKQPRQHVSTFDTYRDSASAQTDFSVRESDLISIGLDWQQDHIQSSTAFNVTSRRNSAGFIEYQSTFGAQQIEVSLRRDENEQFKGHTTGNLGWAYTFADHWMLRTSIGSAFKAPTFNDLYFPFFGNPTLEPEKSHSFNAGITRNTPQWKLAVDAYETRVDNLITYDAALLLPNNIDEARIRGLELTASTTVAGWDLSTQLSHTNPRNHSTGANYGNVLARRARSTGRIDIDRDFGAFHLGATLFGASHRYDDAANNLWLGGYSTFDLRSEYALTKHWTFQARVSNVFNRRYETIQWYNQPGREFAFSLRYSPE